jgi:nitrite reductase/ring-hydroxylating ferredoxin subunit
MSEFVSVAAVASLPPGQGRTVHVRGREFAIWNLDGQFYCIDDQCPHRGGPLGAGTLQHGEVFCPLHGWEFDVKTGARIGENSEKSVACFPINVADGKIQIQI